MKHTLKLVLMLIVINVTTAQAFDMREKSLFKSNYSIPSNEYARLSLNTLDYTLNGSIEIAGHRQSKRNGFMIKSEYFNGDVVMNTNLTYVTPCRNRFNGITSIGLSSGYINNVFAYGINTSNRLFTERLGFISENHIMYSNRLHSINTVLFLLRVNNSVLSTGIKYNMPTAMFGVMVSKSINIEGGVIYNTTSESNPILYSLKLNVTL